MRVVRVSSTSATLRGANGTSYHWSVSTPAVFAVLADHEGEDVMVYWRRTGNDTAVVGVTGPRGAAFPDAPSSDRAA